MTTTRAEQMRARARQRFRDIPLEIARKIGQRVLGLIEQNAENGILLTHLNEGQIVELCLQERPRGLSIINHHLGDIRVELERELREMGFDVAYTSTDGLIIS